MSCRVAAGLTDPRKDAEHKRFVTRTHEGVENGFLMLKCRERISTICRTRLVTCDIVASP